MTALLTVFVALAAMPAFAQKTKKTKPTTTAPVATAAAPSKVSGIVKKPGVADGKFSIGAMGKKNKGTWTIDGSKASVADKKGGSVQLTDIVPGSNVSIEGDIDMKAHTISATKITANYIPKKKGTGATTTTTTGKGKKGKVKMTKAPVAGAPGGN